MSKLQTFNNNVFGELPIMVVEGTEWFGATEAAAALGFSKPHRAIDNHVEEDDSTVWGVGVQTGIKTDGSPAMQTVKKKFINESGLYSLIIGAAKQGNNLAIQERARLFKRWITSEILPTIRKTGGYVANDDLFIGTYLPHADETTRLLFRTTLETVRKQNEVISVMKPKVEAHDRFISGENLQTLNKVAKSLGVGRNKLCEFLRAKSIFIQGTQSPEPYQRYINEGYFKVRQTPSGHFPHNNVQTYVTAKGVNFLDRMIETNGGSEYINGLTLVQIRNLYKGATAI